MANNSKQRISKRFAGAAIVALLSAGAIPAHAAGWAVPLPSAAYLSSFVLETGHRLASLVDGDGLAALAGDTARVFLSSTAAPAALPPATAALTGEPDRAAAAGVDGATTASVRPGVFGSVAIPFANLQTETRWKTVFAAVEQTRFDDCTADANCARSQAGIDKAVEAARALPFVAKLQAVNSAVNAFIGYAADEKVYGRLDYWATPEETLARGEGDCEDFAILKMAALRTVGVPTQSMSLVVLRDRRRNLYHAVLAVSTSQGNYVLDILNDTVRRDDAYPNYQPLYSMSETRSWIHGVRSTGDHVAAAALPLQAVVPGLGPDLLAAANLGARRFAGPDAGAEVQPPLSPRRGSRGR